MTTRHAKPEDIDEMLRFTVWQRNIWTSQAIRHRWKPGHPEQSSTGDRYCKKATLYVCEEDGQLHAAFAFIG